MPPHPDAVLRRLTDRLAPLERDLHRAFWTAATDARPETSAAKQRAEEAWLAALGDAELFAEVQAALAAGGDEVADVVGPLEAADDQHFAVRNRRGELVEIPRDRALAAKVVPPR